MHDARSVPLSLMETTMTAQANTMFDTMLAALAAQTAAAPAAGIGSTSSRPVGAEAPAAGGESTEKAEFIANIGMMAPSLSAENSDLVFNQLSAAFFTLTNAVRDTNGKLKNRKAALHAKLVAGLSKRLAPGEDALYPIPGTPLVMQIRRTGGEKAVEHDDNLDSITADFA